MGTNGGDLPTSPVCVWFVGMVSSKPWDALQTLRDQRNTVLRTKGTKTLCRRQEEFTPQKHSKHPCREGIPFKRRSPEPRHVDSSRQVAREALEILASTPPAVREKIQDPLAALKQYSG